MSEGKKKGGAGKVIGIGCLVIILVLVIGGIIIVKNIGKIGRAAGAKLATVAVEAVINESPLPAAEKQAIMKPIEGLVAEFKSGDLSVEQLGTILSKLAEGPLPGLIAMRTFEVLYIEESSLNDADKKAARVTVSRYAHGRATGKIEGAGFEDVIWEQTTDDEGDTTMSLKEELTSQELQQCLTTMKTAADDAGIAEKEFPMDIGGAVERSIAEAKAEAVQ